MTTLERHFPNPKTPLEQEIAQLGPWFHNLHLGNGVQTAPTHPLGDFPKWKWREIEGSIPKDLRGKRVLDIGCNSGFYSFEMARRGASVLAIDHDERYLRQARWAASKLDLSERIDFAPIDVYGLGKTRDTFDIVLFLGVFYHLRYPLLALDLLRGKVKELFVFQTLTMPDGNCALGGIPENFTFHERERMLKQEWPKMAFIEKLFEGDPTNWWAANRCCIEAMLRSSGFSIVNRPGDETWVCSVAQQDRRALREHTAVFNVELNEQGGDERF